jgi:catechol 2,3-dioxygenase-like lactoylglutathione lyase family enzyme
MGEIAMPAGVAIPEGVQERRLQIDAAMSAKAVADQMRSATFTRAAVLRSLATGALLAVSRQPALAAYTVIPTGSIADKQARLAVVSKLYLETPNDPYVFGEKAQLEYDIEALQRNTDFVTSTRQQTRDGSGHFLQRLTVPVTDMAAAVRFWKDGCGALVRSTRLVDGANVTVIGFGPESLRVDDGAKFSLELVETPGAGVSIGSESQIVQYVQLAMPVFRLSQVMANGGQIESAYGWTQLTAPGGLPLRVRIDESRRDPFELVALRVSKMDEAVQHYTRLGMAAAKPKKAWEIRDNLGLDSLLSSNTIFKESDVFEPDREVGSVLVNFGNAEQNTGLLLLPPKGRKPLALGATGAAEPRLRVVGARPSQGPSVRSADGLAMLFESEEEFEATLSAETQPAR